MDTNTHTLAVLFAQLGLPNQPQDIEQFLAAHHLPSGVPIAQASFWSNSQAAFLREALEQDAEWAESIDVLANLLSH
ncbi:DUF2789 domain-containing protein [Deefgea piscis]|uniref:DUF2789 domain-containing protein n=1 Tax=Deefgea piscis TaxID=2739061 RepID=UPI001C8256B9|nr:DUF2789 domain-containing protein [Deefgea piscis]QZA79971.1 DUF2789 domain-containing protein [Deefgea piscis]